MHRRRDVALAIAVAAVVSVLGVLLLVRVQHRPDTDVAMDTERRAVRLSTSAPDRTPPPPTPVVPARALRPAMQRLQPVPEAASVLSSSALSLPAFDAVHAIDPLSDRVPITGDLEGLLMVEEIVDEPPKVVRRVQPEYPLSAELMGVTGRVVVRIRVSETGAVTAVEVTESEPPGVFDDATVRAIRRWTFTPAVFRGRPVPTWCRTAVVFTLAEEP